MIIIDVKGLNYSFTCKDDCTFAKHGLVVMDTSAWAAKDPKPYATIIVNKERTVMGIVKRSTQEHWIVKTIWNSRYRKYQENYFCPLDRVDFRRLKFEDHIEDPWDDYNTDEVTTN